MLLARLVFDEKTGWPGVGRFPWSFIYDYANIPAFVLAGIALIILSAGLAFKFLGQYRRQAWFVILLLLLGPGLVVNIVLKDNLGRARPREIREFGGNHEYTQMWQKGDTGKNSSFPSGHSSVGFFMTAPWFLLRRKKKGLASAFLAGGIGLGALIGAARILQGGHFLSDVMWSGGLVYITGEVLALLILPEESA